MAVYVHGLLWIPRRFRADRASPSVPADFYAKIRLAAVDVNVARHPEAKAADGEGQRGHAEGIQDERGRAPQDQVIAQARPDWPDMQVHWAVWYYQTYGFWTSAMSALTCWAIIAGLK